MRNNPARLSAWRLLESNEDAPRWRLELADSAQHSIELQYYFWWQSARARESTAKLQGSHDFWHLPSRIPVGIYQRRPVGFD